MGVRRVVFLAAVVVGVGATMTGTAHAAQLSSSPCDQWAGAKEYVQGQTGMGNTQHYCAIGGTRVHTFTPQEEAAWHPESVHETPEYQGRPYHPPEPRPNSD